MSERFSIPLEYIRTAKRGTFQDIASTVMVLRRFVWNAENCDFHARTDGAFYLATGESAQRLLLVAPDNTLDFGGMKSMTVDAALAYIITVCHSPGIPGWDEFAGWFDGLIQQYGQGLAQSLQSITVGSLTTTNIPAYTVSGTGAENFFIWLRAALISAETETGVTLNMADYWLDSVSYVLPVTLTAEVEENGETKIVTIPLSVEMRE